MTMLKTLYQRAKKLAVNTEKQVKIRGKKPFEIKINSIICWKFKNSYLLKI